MELDWSKDIAVVKQVIVVNGYSKINNLLSDFSFFYHFHMRK
jgi:hypothetical protein